MTSLILIGLALLANAYVINSYEWGGEANACDAMLPIMASKMTEMIDDSYYRVSPNIDTFYPGQKLYIRIKGRTSVDRYTYMGALLAVKKNGAVGVWEEFHADKYKRISCGGAKYTGIVESNNRMKVVGDDVFIWTAPDKCDLDDPFYELSGTVIMNDNSYISGLNTLLRCVEMPVMLPKMMVKDACMDEYSMIPVAETSFENNYGGWWNDPMSALRWSRHTNGTKSPETGPDKALEGKWYIYSEASSPAKQGDMAILNSPIGLAGCFCIRLRCHMYVGPGTRFDLMVDGVSGFNHVGSVDKWISAYESVNVPGDVQVQLKMTRGSDFRGDIAIDELSFTPGMCEEDIMV